MAGPARAHFLWLTVEGETPTTIQAFLSETPTPEGPEFLKHIEQAKITAGAKVLVWKKVDDTYRMNLQEPRPDVVDGTCDLGIKKRDGVSFNLRYTARVQFEPSHDAPAELGDQLRMRLVTPQGKNPFVVVRFRGQPIAGAVVKVFPEEGDLVELKSDARGRVEHALVGKNGTAFLGKWSEKSPGVLEGKSYDEIRYYATLTMAPAGPDKAPATAIPPANAPFALLPEAVNSFGGAVLGDWLYVYSGHTGKTHQYDESTTTKHFRRLNLKDRSTWEELPCGPALQGVVLIAHQNCLYRIGGMAAHNRPGEPNNLKSVAEFARFEPKTTTWTTMPPMPSPRSTHDAVLIGDKIYVVGGWSLEGGDSANNEFLETALVFDLSQMDGRWESLPATPPFRRRALTVASIKGKIYVLGGLTDNGKVVKSVDLYDPATDSWVRGPDLPGSQLQGFGPSAFGVGEKLYFTGIDGLLHRLNEAGDRWEVVGKLTVPRLTHRLLPGIANDLLAVGGNHAKQPIRLIESIPLAGSSCNPD